MQINDRKQLQINHLFIPLFVQAIQTIAPQIYQRTPQKTVVFTNQTSLQSMFPEQKHDEKHIQKAKEILGELANEFLPGELEATVAEIQFLTQSWLDDLEKSIFNGLTLQELLHERGVL